jgi:hydrogenase maturation factor HypF (carbamoyltransferase family)
LERLLDAEGEMQNIDEIETYEILAEALAGEKPAVKIEILTRYLEITRQNTYVIEEVQRRFQAQGKPLSRQELKDFLMTALTVLTIELKQAGVSQKISAGIQKLVVSGKVLPGKKGQEGADEEK